MFERWILITLSAILLIIITVFPFAGIRVQQFVRGNFNADEALVQPLRAENEVLKAVVSQFASIPLEPFLRDHKGVSVPVFSQYPFSIKHELLLAQSESQPLRAGQAVVIPVSQATSTTGVLLGRIERTESGAAVAMTIFDAQWRSSVRVGDAGAQALLVGGTEPKLTLLAKDAAVSEGDVVYSADARFPFGLPVAEVKSATLTSDKTSQEASLKLPYDLGFINVVSVITDYEPPQNR